MLEHEGRRIRVEVPFAALRPIRLSALVDSTRSRQGPIGPSGLHLCDMGSNLFFSFSKKVAENALEKASSTAIFV